MINFNQNFNWIDLSLRSKVNNDMGLKMFKLLFDNPNRLKVSYCPLNKTVDIKVVLDDGEKLNKQLANIDYHEEITMDSNDIAEYHAKISVENFTSYINSLAVVNNESVNKVRTRP